MEIGIQYIIFISTVVMISGVFIIFCVIDFYQKPVIRNYSLSTEKLDTGQSIKLLLLSDLHSYIFGGNQDQLISMVKKEKPDIIALTGDIADDIFPIKGIELFLKAIEGIAPIYYVTGNHEFRSKNISSIKALFKKHHVVILEHQYEKLCIKDIPLIIGGVEDPSIKQYENPSFDWEKTMHNAFSKLNEEKAYKILLSHRPERIKAYKNTPFDLVLSGHAHGGQVIIPYLINGLYAPNQGLFPKYAGGMYKHEKLVHIVSRGLSYHFLRPRVFNPREIVVIEICAN